MTGYSVKKLFFDAPAVLKALDAGERKSLSKIGAFLRTRERSSMKVRKNASVPSKPPSAHNRKLKDLIFFSYDFATKSVVIGPTPFRAGTAPRVLEEGGIAVIKKRGTERVIRRVIRPRPYAGPALAAEIQAGTIPQALKDSVRSN
jgi:hypothetical protein